MVKENANVASNFQSLDISIARMGVHLECDQPDILTGLKQRYRCFCTRSDQPLRIQVEIHRGLGFQLDNPSIHFSGDVVEFSDPAFHSQNDFTRLQAHLKLNCSDPIPVIDEYIRRLFSLLAFRSGGMMLHSAGIVRKEKAYLFLGPSGSGKTTVSRLSQGATVLNDDLVILMPKKNVWHVYATPFSNPTQVPPNLGNAPLAGMYRLIQDKQVFLEEMKSSRALAEIFSRVLFAHDDHQQSELLLSRCQTLLELFPVQGLHFLPDDSFWKLISTK